MSDGVNTGGAPKRRRRADAAERRRAILDAALVVFLAEGYAAARLDDVASRAGVAKGTIYLYFEDKEALFRALVHEAVDPVITGAEGLLSSFTGPTADLLRAVALRLEAEVLGTTRKDVLRLVMTEAPRFPWLAEFYWRQVVQRGMGLIRAIAKRAVERGEFASDALVRFPQILPAPMLVAVLWSALFERFEPLETRGFIEAWVEVLIRGLERRTP